MTIHLDPKFGHVRVTDHDGREVATIVDGGPSCHVDVPGPLTTSEAIDVGRALVKWAGNVRKRRGEA